MENKLFISINSPEKVIWEGEATAVSSENSRGAFDILPGHANFVTIIEKKPLIVHREDGDREFPMATAIVYVRSDIVTVYTNI